jgi:hypothetical protein
VLNTDEPAFRKADYTIVPLDYTTAMELVVEKHYLHRKAPCSHAFGLMRGSEIVGVVVYGVSASSTLLRGVAGDEEKQNVYELTRLWVDDSVPRNGESYLISNTIKKLDKEYIVSYADSSQNHLGYVYQATNFLYTGLSAKFRDPKVRGLEDKHHTSYANGMTNKEVIAKFGAENVYFVERPRKHRYVFINAKGFRRKVLLKKLRYKVLPYPKPAQTC